MNRVKSSLVKLLQSKKLYIIIPIIAFILAAPSIGSGLMMDDYYHKLVFAGTGELQERVSFSGKSLTPFDAFIFMDGKEEVNRHTKATGLIPWWSSDNLKVAFFRPIASLSHLVDYTLWPGSPAAMHLHSILLYCILSLLIVYLYRSLELPGWSAGLAALLLVLNHAWSMPVGWLANRNALLALLFALPSLIFYHRYRMQGSLKFQLVALALFVMALLSGEAGLAIFGYIFSYTLFMDSSRWRSRLKAIAPFIVIVLVWRLGYSLAGFGAKGGSIYIDPSDNPLIFGATLLERYFLFIGGMWGGAPVELLTFLAYQLNTILAVAAFIIITLLALLFRPLWQKNRRALFWAVGMFCSILPFCLALPASRNLVFPYIGGMGLFAMILYSYRREGRSESYKGFFRGLVVTYFTLFLLVNVLISPLLFFLSHANIRQVNELSSKAYEIEGLDEIAEPDKKELIFLNLPLTMVLSYGFDRHLKGRAMPGIIRVLSVGSEPVEAGLLDDRTLAVKPQSGFYPPPGALREGDSPISMKYGERRFELLFCRGERKSAVGERFEAGDLVVEVKELTPDSRPGEVNYHFAKPLNSPNYILVTWDYEKNRPVLFTLPEPGESIKIN